MHKTVSDGLLAARLSAPGRLTTDCDVGAFACGDPVLDGWIRRRALRRDARGARTYAVCAERRVAGFFCLAAGLVVAPDRVGRGAPHRREEPRDAPIPVAILRRLAVDSAWQGRGLGADLLMNALQRVVATGADLGIRAVLARAVEDRARAFYAAFGFVRLDDGDAETMLMPVETAEGVLRGA
ncbi:GNAT family N-acetyltransferase [Salinarimonas sp. NSM]|uniref:GNAT family N-acetyltransferase n=1 Tax=Salinarimonas sp. NSM TaxID=3458003 RepID=UPI0040369D40